MSSKSLFGSLLIKFFDLVVSSDIDWLSFADLNDLFSLLSVDVALNGTISFTVDDLCDIWVAFVVVFDDSVWSMVWFGRNMFGGVIIVMPLWNEKTCFTRFMVLRFSGVNWKNIFFWLIVRVKRLGNTFNLGSRSWSSISWNLRLFWLFSDIRATCLWLSWRSSFYCSRCCWRWGFNYSCCRRGRVFEWGSNDFSWLSIFLLCREDRADKENREDNLIGFDFFIFLSMEALNTSKLFFPFSLIKSS